jgi:hypothetical protein
MIVQILTLIRDTPIGDVMRDSSWLYTFFLILHFAGFTMLFGGLLVIDLRVLGVAKRIPLDQAIDFLPFVIAGFVINAITGFCFFSFQPFELAANWSFKIKMLLVLLAGLNALYFTVVEEKKLRVYAAAGREPNVEMKVSAVLSLGIWLLVIIAGRLIVAFQGSSSLFGNG